MVLLGAGGAALAIIAQAIHLGKTYPCLCGEKIGSLSFNSSVD